MMQWLKDNKAILAAVALIIIAGLLLRVYDLGTESLWHDEAESIYESTLSLKEISSHSNQPPLYFIILNWWIHLWGSGEIAIRSLSVIFGVLAILMTFLVGKELFNNRVGAIGSVLSAVSQFSIFYSQDARAYSLLLLLSLVSYYFFIRILKRDKTWNYPCYFLATVLLGYTHIYGLFILSSQIVYFLIFWKKYKLQRVRLISTFTVIIISLSPIVILLGHRVMSVAKSGFWIPRPSLMTLSETFLEYASGFRITRFSPESTNSTLSTTVKYILLLLYVVLALFSLLFLTREKNKQKTSKSRNKSRNKMLQSNTDSASELVLLILWLFFPILLPFIASQLLTPIYLSRYTIAALPAFYLLVARGTSIFGKKMLTSVLIVIVLLSSLGLYNYYTVDIKEQWREAANFVESESKDGDVIVFCQPYVQRPFDYYYRG
jgi:mannosyltransferase